MTGSGGRPAPPDRRRLLAGLVIPLSAFIVLRTAVGNATAALAISDALPLLWVVEIAILRRRIDRIALIPFAVFAVALVLSITFGGSALPLELRRSVFPGAIGIALLGSVAMRQPLLALAARRVAQAAPERDPGLRLDPARVHRTLTVMTVILGITGVVDAAAQVTLALTVSVTAFGELARLASYVTIGTGLAACALYVRARRSASSPSSHAPDGPAEPRDPGRSGTRDGG
jgi:hypothetical protein